MAGQDHGRRIWCGPATRRGRRAWRPLSLGVALWLCLLQLCPAGGIPPASAAPLGPAGGEHVSASTHTPGAAAPGGAAAAATAVPTPRPAPAPPVQPASRAAASPADALGALRFITPVRVVDTRAEAGGPIGFNPGGGALAAGAFQPGQTRRFLLAGQTFAGTPLPADLTGVLLNVTIVQTEASGGFVTVFPGDVATPPNASTVNPATAIAANFWATAVPTAGPNAGTVAVFSTNALHILLDVVGYYSPSNPAPGAAGAVGALKFVNPVRVLDTRAESGGPIGFNPDGSPVAAGALAAGVTRRFRLAGQSFGGLTFPADVSGIVAHVTLVQPQASGGFAALFPGDAASLPNVSTVNPSTAIAFNSWATGIPTTGPNAGTFSLYSTNPAHLLVDVVGYFAPSNPPTLGDLTLVSPLRVLDTRGGTGGPIGFDADGAALTAGQLAPGATRTFTFGGKSFPGGSLPADVSGVLANVTIVQPSASGGFVTAYPGNGTLLPNVSTVNPATAIAASFWANGIASGGPFAGREAIYSTNALDVVVDVVGYFRPPPPPPAPSVVAPPLPQERVTDLYSASAFLYSGANPIQTGVVASTIVPTRTAVLHGKAFSRDGQPLPNVNVSVLSHPEFGQTRTRADGRFDLAVNGGGQLILDYALEGFMASQRQVQAPWQDFANVPDTVMVPIDPAVTTVDLTSAAPFQVARGSVVTDGDGSRRATLLFPRGTQASMKLPDGSTRVLTPTISVRATEYTVGASGPAAMPGELPPSSQYTYAVAYTVDEAQAMGAVSVNFSPAVVSYTENFINMPVGTSVPVGYYDRQSGVWVPSPNGRIVKVLNVTGGLAQLDVDGGGNPAGAPALAALGITDAERAQIAQLWTAGQSLSRFTLTHFTDFDPNFVPAIAPSAVPPDPPPSPPANRPLDNGCLTNGSIIDCEGQSLGETLPVVGTPFTLHYQSSRMPGNASARTATIQLVGSNVAAGMKRIELETKIAGQITTQTFGIGPNQVVTFTWDGKDAFGRTVQGTPKLHYKISYVYNGVYSIPLPNIPESFGYYGGSTVTLNQARKEITYSVERDVPLGSLRGQDFGPGLGGWSLDVHHAYDPLEGALYLGDGTRLTAQSSAPFGISTVSGTGPGVNDNLNAQGLAIGPDGTVYYSEDFAGLVRRRTPDGQVVIVAGSGAAHGSGGGDGGPATQAELNQPNGLAIGRDGSLYIADVNNHRVRRVAPDGVINTVAGKASAFGTFSGDNGPATAANLSSPGAVAVGRDGALFIADTGNCRIRRVSTSGVISTAAGTGSCGFSGDGGQSTGAQISHATGLAVGRDGSLYIADANNHRIRRVRPDGTISTYAGNGSAGLSGDGGAATAAQLNTPTTVALSPTDDLYIGDLENRRIRVVTTDGVINTFAGVGVGLGAFGENQPAVEANLTRITGLAYGPDGAIYVAQPSQSQLRRIRQPQPNEVVGDLRLPSADGQRLFNISGGRHVKTVHGLTGATMFAFGYDTAGRLTSVTDGDGKVTTIERNNTGAPTAIVSPFGQRTALGLNTEGYLSSVANPAGEATTLTYTAGGTGLLTSLTDPRGGVHTFTYDAKGRLTRDTNPTGGFTNLVRTDKADGYTVTRTNALGETTVHDVTYLGNGDIKRVVTHPGGSTATSLQKPGGQVNSTDIDGVETTNTIGPDARFGLLAPLSTANTTTTPGNLTLTTTLVQTVQTASPFDPFAMTSLTTNSSTNGAFSTGTYLAASRTLNQTSAAGRTSTMTSDLLGRSTQQSRGGLLPQNLVYNTLGQLTSASQGTGPETRTTAYTYNAAGFRATRTDAEGRLTTYTHDAAGRQLSQTLPGGRAVGQGYDAAGNTVSVTPPGRPAHTATFDANHQVLTRTLPDIGGGVPRTTAYAYNAEGRLTAVTRPDGSTIGYAYNATGRRSGLTIARGTVTTTYDAAGREASVTAPGGIAVSTTYDGTLPKTITATGPGAGTITWQYDANLRPASVALNAAPPVSFAYDLDGLITQAGQLSLTNDFQSGLLTATQLGAVADTTTYNGFGEPSGYSATGAGALYSAQYTRDRLGRITTLVETIGGVQSTYTYTYDTAGRLATVAKNNVQTAAYAYDANGNRTAATGNPGPFVYDARDRLVQSGTTTFTYNAAGDLTGRTTPGGTTSYQYDALGNLVAATLPGGTQLAYLIDGRDRRVGKRVNGVLQQGFLYQDNLRPIAEFDGAGGVVSRFVYAYGVNAPEYMVKGGTNYRLVYDHIGSVRLVVDANTGTVVQRLDYDEFGRVLLDTNPGFQPFGFGGGLYDRDTGLVRFGFRDYDPETGRWTTPDPTGFSGGDTNLYAYSANDPVNLGDVWGTGWGTKALLAGLVVVGVASGVGSLWIAGQALMAAGAAGATTAATIGGTAVATFATANGVAAIGGSIMNAQKIASTPSDELSLSSLGPSSAIGFATQNASPLVKNIGAVVDIGINHKLAIEGSTKLLTTANAALSSLPTYVNDATTVHDLLHQVGGTKCPP